MQANEVYHTSTRNELTHSEDGGLQSKVDYRFDLLNPDAMLDLARVMCEGEVKYGPDNWKYITVADNINHAIGHLYQALQSKSTDADTEDHLAHAFARIHMALAKRAILKRGFRPRRKK